MPLMLKTVVFGATGFAGSAIAAEALGRGHEVVGVARSFENVTAPEGIATRAGTIYDHASVRELADWAEAIVIALPGREIDGHSLADEIPALLKIIGSGSARLGIVGGAGGLALPDGSLVKDAPDFPDAAKPEAGGTYAVFEAIRDSGTDVDWFYLAPSRRFGRMNPGEPTGHYRVGSESLLIDANGDSAISGADFALAFVDELEEPRHHRERFTVGY